MAEISKRISKYQELIPILAISILVFLILLIYLELFYPSPRIFLILIFVPILIVLLLNFKLMYRVFILAFFIEFGIYYFYLSTLLFPFVTISFLLNYTVKYSEIKNQIFYYFLIFLISIIPSYFMAASHPESYLISFNLLGFIAILLITPITLKNLNNVKNIAIYFLIGCILNAIYLIIMASISGKREFGFAGIMYVDLGGIGIILTYSSLLLFKKFKILFGIMTIVLILSLLFTQTRNSWITTGSVMLILTLYYIIKSKQFKILNLYSFKKIALIIISIISLIIILGIVEPNVFSRVAERKTQTTEQLAVTMDFGSIATRFFIWEIAFSVFEANPIFGTGFHSFRFISNSYSTLDPYLYGTFVYNLTPHTTILALLADTGILGFIGFLIFLYLIIRFFKQNLDFSITTDQKIISFMLFWCQIYIIISMVMTDAWLWGTLHMLWAVLLGVAVFLRKDIKRTQESVITANSSNER